jgi:hypothetical protein
MKANWRFQEKARPRGTASLALPWSAPICRRLTTAAGRRATKRNSWTAIFPNETFYLAEADIPEADRELKAVNLTKDTFHGEWNYTIKPNYA